MLPGDDLREVLRGHLQLCLQRLEDRPVDLVLRHVVAVDVTAAQHAPQLGQLPDPVLVELGVADNKTPAVAHVTREARLVSHNITIY